MKLTIGTGELSLPEDFTFEIESNHPFFSDEGTASVPVTIPASPENLKLLGYPEDPHSPRRHVREQMAHLTAGTFRRRCRLITESAGKAAGISASLAFMESEIYAELQERKLHDIFYNYTYIMTKTAGHSYLPADVYEGRARNALDVAIFPVATDLESDGSVFILNEPDTEGLKDHARTEDIDGVKTAVPAGYGITPFLYLWALIQNIFEAAGYTVRSNPFLTDSILKNIVVVNNCADSSCDEYPDWRFSYSDLVPDMTVGELLENLHDVFGAYVTFDSGIVDIRLVKDDINAVPDASLDNYSRGDDVISYPEPYNLKRSFDTSLDNAEPAAETMQALRNLYETVSVVITESAVSGTGLFLVSVLGRYFYKQTASSEAKAIGTNCFAYHRDLNMEPEEMSADNRFLPMIKVGDRYMPYIGKRIHRHLDVAKSGDSPEQALQFCYAHFSSDLGRFCGSSYSYLETGGWITDGALRPSLLPALTPEGLNYLWRDYETLLVNGAPEIEVSLDIPFERLMLLDRFTPKTYNGCKVMIKSLSYTVDDSGIANTKAVLWILPEYDDGIHIPPTVIFGTSYGWKLVSTRRVFDGQDGYTVIQSDGLASYTAADAPESRPTAIGTIAKKRSRWLRYEHTESHNSWLSWGTSTSTGTHTWEEYFISEAQGE